MSVWPIPIDSSRRIGVPIADPGKGMCHRGRQRPAPVPHCDGGDSSRSCRARAYHHPRHPQGTGHRACLSDPGEPRGRRSCVPRSVRKLEREKRSILPEGCKPFSAPRERLIRQRPSHPNGGFDEISGLRTTRAWAASSSCRPPTSTDPGPIVCRERLDGLLRFYHHETV
jgi:hypothetical protein